MRCTVPRFHTCYGWLPFWDWLYSTDNAIEDSPVHFAQDIRPNIQKSEVCLNPSDKKRE